MSSRTVFRAAFIVLLFTTIAIADDSPATGYQKGTITQDFSPTHRSYALKTGDNGYQINNCGDFQNDQVVDYRVKGDKVYIRRDDGKDYKCAIEATLMGNPSSADVPAPPKYQKGTVEGFEIRRDVHVSGGGGNNSVSQWTRHAKVYELHGADLIYKVDYCGAFQAGQFTAGQVVEYRLDPADAKRLYIRHDSDKEYSCQLEGTRMPETEATNAAAKTDPGSSSLPATTAKLSITSVPDGADIEVDGNFSGNTPSDLEVPEGQHSITVKKSGYQDWQRTVKVAAGSKIHLNAEMEKTPNP